jgi:hypothetical protein
MINNYNEMQFNNILSTDGITKDLPKIRVVIRKRPANKKEITKGDIDIIETRNSTTMVVKELK